MVTGAVQRLGLGGTRRSVTGRSRGSHARGPCRVTSLSAVARVPVRVKSFDLDGIWGDLSHQREGNGAKRTWVASPWSLSLLPHPHTTPGRYTLVAEEGGSHLVGLLMLVEMEVMETCRAFFNLEQRSTDIHWARKRWSKKA